MKKNMLVKGFSVFMCAATLMGCSALPVNPVSVEPEVTVETVEQDNASDSTSVSASNNEELVKKCLEGYAQYLKEHTDLWEQETVYAFDYINDDDIPDLMFGDTSGAHAANTYVLTYLDGNYDEVVCCGTFGSYGAACYYPGLGIMYDDDTGMGYIYENYSKLSATGKYGCETVCHRYEYYEGDYDEDPSEVKFYITDGEEKEVTEEEYNAYVKELVGDAEYSVFYTCNNDKGHEYLNQEAIDNLFNF